MDKLTENKYTPDSQEGNERKTNLPGYLSYLSIEDLYVQRKKEEEIVPEQIPILKQYRDPVTNPEKDFGDDVSDINLDVFGFELDDNGEETTN